MRLAIAALASFVSVGPAFADILTLMGELDGRAIQVELIEPEHGDVAGRYTFIDDGADIPLLPVSVEDGVWILAEEAPCTEGTCVSNAEGVVDKPPVAATWRITYDKAAFSAAATRTLVRPKSKTPPFQLDVIAWRGFSGEATAYDLHDYSARLSYDTTLTLDWSTAPYEMLLLDIDLPPSEITESNGIQWTYVTDPRSNLTFPRILTDSEAVARFGIAFNAHFYSMSLAALECKAFRYAAYGMNEFFAGLGGNTAGYEDETITLSYLSPTLASWSESGSLYCQGASPYNHINNFTYDVVAGTEMEWRKVFAAFVPRAWLAPLDDIAETHAALADPDNYTWGPDLEFIAYIQQSRPRFDDELEEYCGTDEDMAEHLSFRVIGDDEIMFALSGFPHVASVCNGDLFSAKLADLAPFLAPTASDYFPVLNTGVSR